MSIKTKIKLILTTVLATTSLQIIPYQNPIIHAQNIKWQKDDHNTDLITTTYGPNHNIIYYRYQASPKLKSAFNRAIQKWNHLNVIKFKPALNQHVIQTKIVNQKANAKTHTSYQFEITPYKTPNQMTNIQIKINLKHKPKHQSWTNVFETQLGHSLGFKLIPKHNNQKINLLKYHYNLN